MGQISDGWWQRWRRETLGWTSNAQLNFKAITLTRFGWEERNWKPITLEHITDFTQLSLLCPFIQPINLSQHGTMLSFTHTTLSSCQESRQSDVTTNLSQHTTARARTPRELKGIFWVIFSFISLYTINHTCPSRTSPLDRQVWSFAFKFNYLHWK